MGNYPTLSHIGATYSFTSGNCQQKFQIFRGFLCYFELKMTVNILMLNAASYTRYRIKNLGALPIHNKSQRMTESA